MNRSHTRQFWCAFALLLGLLFAQYQALAHDHDLHKGVAAEDCALVHFSAHGAALPAAEAAISAPLGHRLFLPDVGIALYVQHANSTRIRAPPFSSQFASSMT